MDDKYSVVLCAAVIRGAFFNGRQYHGCGGSIINSLLFHIGSTEMANHRIRLLVVPLWFTENCGWICMASFLVKTQMA